LPILDSGNSLLELSFVVSGFPPEEAGSSSCRRCQWNAVCDFYFRIQKLVSYLRYQTSVGIDEWFKMHKMNELLSSLNLGLHTALAFHMR
jgi:hypothetical protein